MESANTYDFDTADDFWEAVDNTLSRDCNTHDLIDDALRSYLTLTTTFRDQFVQSEDDLGYCAYKLYTSPLFAQHAEYIRRQMVYCLLQEDDDVDILRLVVTFLTFDARENESTFELMNSEMVFPRLVQLIANPKEHEEIAHRLLMELLYEMARMQKITNDDLTCVDDDFIRGLFDLIELVSDDVNDPYHYPVIRVLFMVSAHDPAVLAQKAAPLTNKVVKVLSTYGSHYKTFGANIILLLNREDETSLQLLTLKLMYLLFTTPPTYEYFYTNDLRVLVDILIRNLLDLPEYAIALRHTYLRVLYPLLEHTQLQYPPYYKRDELRKLLSLLCGDVNRTEQDTSVLHWNHFEDVDETTKRLVKRCRTVTWLVDEEPEELARIESPVDEKEPSAGSPVSPTKNEPPALPAPRKLKKRNSSKSSTLTVGQYLTPQLESARQSSLSMHEMAAQKEKPGVITPSRNPSLKHGLRQAIMAKKEKPPVPKARRSGFLRMKSQSSTTELEVTKAEVHDEDIAHDDKQEEPPEDVSRTEQPIIAKQSDEKKEIESDEKAKPTKKPPPAPKARRWGRGKRNKEETEERDPNKEPGKFSSEMPSIITSEGERSPFSPVEAQTESSPFSPISEKKLLGNEEFDLRPGEKRSVSAAMQQVHAQAVQSIEQCLENTHIDNEADRPERESPTLQQHHLPPPQIVLAPPGQAPIRGVPGPRLEVERSPFLSDEEDFNVIEEESESNDQ